MKQIKPVSRILAGLCLLAAFASGVSAGPAGRFEPKAGQWRLQNIEGQDVLVVDGSSPGAKAHFPLAVDSRTTDFREGSVTVRFRPIAGKSDQAGGIAFDLKDSGDYLVIRANALENNLNLYRTVSGRRSPVKEVENAPTQSGVWHELTLTVAGSRVTGSLDGKPLLEYDLGRPVSGGVGLWSKDDSVVYFKDFNVTSGAR